MTQTVDAAGGQAERAVVRVDEHPAKEAIVGIEHARGQVGTHHRHEPVEHMAQDAKARRHHAAGVAGMDAFAAKVDFPDPPVPAREHPDLRLAPGSTAVAAGIILPNLNDGFAGKAPDMGAYELGQELPYYGPRPEGEDELTEWEKIHSTGR